MKSWLKPVVCFSMTLLILSLSVGPAHAKNDKAKMKHRGMDGNNDGVITREEWRGNNTSFNNQDWNGDGVLSGNEVRSGARQQTTSFDRFRELDDNNDGYISWGEWNGTSRSFDQLDRNDDGRLSRNEFNNRSRIPVAVFSELDDNNDGRITRGEWRSDASAFNRLDANRDDLLSENEFNGRKTGSLMDQLFQEILGK